MQNKTTLVFSENQVNDMDKETMLQVISALETQAKRIMNAVSRRIIVITTFPNNLLNKVYQEKNSEAIALYGKLIARAGTLRIKCGLPPFNPAAQLSQPAGLSQESMSVMVQLQQTEAA